MATTKITKRKPAVHSPPSARSATALARGEEGALAECVFHTAFRAGLIAVGMHVAGVRRDQLFRAAVGGAIAIECFLVAYAAYMEQQA